MNASATTTTNNKRSIETVSDESQHSKQARVHTVAHGYVERVKVLCKLARGISFDHPLLWAVNYGTLEDVRAVVEYGKTCANAYLNDADVEHYAPSLREEWSGFKEGNSPICIAAMHGKLDVIKYLVSQGADMEGYFLGRSALAQAVRYGELEIAAYLLNNGAIIDATDSNTVKTPLMIAAEKGHVEMIRLLISHHANVNAIDERKRTALWHAVYVKPRDIIKRINKEDIVIALMEAGGNHGINPRSKTCLLLRKAYPNAFKRFFGRTQPPRKAKF